MEILIAILLLAVIFGRGWLFVAVAALAVNLVLAAIVVAAIVGLILYFSGRGSSATSV